MSTSSSTSKKCCYSGCSGHPTTYLVTPFPSSHYEFMNAVTGRPGFIFEHLKECLLQLKAAEVDVERSRFKLPNGFCIPVLDTIKMIMIGMGKTQIETISLENRLVSLFIARQVREYILKHPNLVNDADARRIDGAENFYLTYDSDDHGPDHLCKISEKGDVSRYLSPDQIKAITHVPGSISTTIAEPMARSIVNTIHVKTSGQECMNVPELAFLPPGLLPIVISYVTDPVDDLSAPRETSSAAGG